MFLPRKGSKEGQVVNVNSFQVCFVQMKWDSSQVIVMPLGSNKCVRFEVAANYVSPKTPRIIAHEIKFRFHEQQKVGVRGVKKCNLYITFQSYYPRKM